MSSSNIILGSEYLHSLLAKVFKMCIVHGFTTEEFNSTIIVPIPKCKSKSLSDSNNYRGIALNAVLRKFFEYILLEKLSSYIYSINYQFRYKDANSTALSSFIVNKTNQYYNNQGTN